MTRRVDPPDLLQLARSALRLARALERAVEHALGQGAPVNAREYLLLRLLQSGPLSPGDVARELNLPPANVSRAVRRLEERELIERSVDPTDQRRAVLRLTPEGEATVDFARERVSARLQELFGRPSDDWLANTERRIARLVELADAPQGAPPPW